MCAANQNLIDKISQILTNKKKLISELQNIEQFHSYNHIVSNIANIEQHYMHIMTHYPVSNIANMHIMTHYPRKDLIIQYYFLLTRALWNLTLSWTELKSTIKQQFSTVCDAVNNAKFAPVDLAQYSSSTPATQFDSNSRQNIAQAHQAQQSSNTTSLN